MKIKIKSFNGELPSYLTMGKVYKASRLSNDLFGFMSDDGRSMIATFKQSTHLNGGWWEVVNE
jgi:hypothetical protein